MKKILKQFVIYLLISFSVIFSTLAVAEPKVVFLSPGPAGSGFWGQVANFMQAVANDLDIDLNIIYSKGNTYSIKKDGLKALNADDAPDYFITGYWEGVTDRLLQAASDKDIRFFIINTVIPDEFRPLVGRPREKYSNWIAHMSPDEKQAGYDLASVLIEKAKQNINIAQGDKVEMVGITGDLSSAVSWLRSEGLKKSVATADKAKLHKVISSSWTLESAEKTAFDLLNNFPGANALWAVSDGMAEGGLRAMHRLGRKPGSDIVLGGIDWTQTALSAIRKGDMTASLGGHFLEGGWALVLIHDYHYGFDFIDDLGVRITTPMQVITADNIDEYEKVLDMHTWEGIDFKHLSKKYNLDLKRYDFSMRSLLNKYK